MFKSHMCYNNTMTTKTTKFKVCEYQPCHNLLISPGHKKSKKYCSKECITQSTKVRTECSNPLCATLFISYRSENRKYCSSSCAAIVSNAVTPRRKKSSPRLDNICFRCGVEIPSSRKFCDGCWYSRADWGVYDKGISWEKGNIEVATGSNGGLLFWAKQYLIRKSSDKCTECGWCEPNPVLGRAILTVDHIDGNWQNNSIDNLKVLCFNCHTLTETFGSLNAGNSPAPRPGLYRVVAS